MEQVNKTDASTQAKWLLLFFISSVFLLTGVLIDPLPEVLAGFWRIQISPSVLTTDYLVVGGDGATLWNSAVVILVLGFILRITKVKLSGFLLAVIILVSGFSFFGTDLVNSSPIMLGTMLYARTKQMNFGEVAGFAFLGSALGPLVSSVALLFDFPLWFSIPAALAIGIAIGFIVPILAPWASDFHKGFSLYNVGFVSGMIGMIWIALFRMFGMHIKPADILSQENHRSIELMLIVVFSTMLIYGFVLNGKKLAHYSELLEDNGRFSPDFVKHYGVGITIVNMGIMGLVAIVYVELIGGSFNGPVIGGVLSVAGFAAIGKHPINSVPIMLGVYLTSLISPDLNPSDTSQIATALFGMALAPIAGEFGVVAGILTGFLHTALVTQVLPTHSGVNLHNNGFSSGFVAFFLVPILIFFRRKYWHLYWKSKI